MARRGYYGFQEWKSVVDACFDSTASDINFEGAGPPMCSATSGERAMCVRLGSVVTPAKFWAIEMPSIGPLDPSSSLGIVLALELSLDKLYASHTDPKGVLNAEDVWSGLLVAARPYPEGHWYRARVVSVLREECQVMVNVFLIDYGEYCNELLLPTSVRELPRMKKLFPKPLAFQIVLAGLRPLSWRLDFECPFKKVDRAPALKWSQAAANIVHGLWNALPEKLASLKFWEKDAMGRCHGVLEFNGFVRNILLNSLLVMAGYAKYFNQALDWDLKKQEESETSFLSICGRSEQSMLGADLTEENQQQRVLSVSDNSLFCERESQTPQLERSVPFEFLDPETGTKPNNYRRLPNRIIQRLDGPSERPSIASFHGEESDECNAADVSFLIGGGATDTSNRGQEPRIGQKYRQAMQKVHDGLDTIDIEGPNRNYDVFRRSSLRSSFHEGISEAEESEDDDLLGDSMMRKLDLNNTKIMRVPSGVDTGRFLQEQLKRIPDGRRAGPKQIADIL